MEYSKSRQQLSSTASVLKMGALMAKPDASRTVGEVMLQSLAEWVKIMLGVVSTTFNNCCCS